MRGVVLENRQLANPNTQQHLSGALVLCIHHSMSKHKYQVRTHSRSKHTSNPFGIPFFCLTYNLPQTYDIYTHFSTYFPTNFGGFFCRKRKELSTACGKRPTTFLWICQINTPLEWRFVFAVSNAMPNNISNSNQYQI
jgi:hypothetical protein